MLRTIRALVVFTPKWQEFQFARINEKEIEDTLTHAPLNRFSLLFWFSML